MTWQTFRSKATVTNSLYIYNMYTVSKNMSTLASCSFEKHVITFYNFFVNSISLLSKMICIFNFSFPFTFTYFVCF